MTVPEQRGARLGRHTVILCHPDPNSFNHVIANAYCDVVRAAGQETVMRDLYAIGFDPVMKAEERPTIANPIRSRDVTAELEIISGSDVFVLIYPIWFGSPPAMMKGYIERVLGTGVRPEAVEKRVGTDLLGGKRLLSFTTSAASNVWLNEQGQEQGLRSVLDEYLVHAFGMHSQEHKRFDQITTNLSQQCSDQYFLEVVTQARRTCAQIAFGQEALHPLLVRQSSH